MGLDVAISLLLTLLGKSTEISMLIAQVQKEGRTQLTPEEWKTLLDADDAARKALLDAIMAKKTPTP